MCRAEQCDRSCDERSRGAGPDSLNVGRVAEVEAAEAVAGVGWKAVDGVREAGAAGSANPSANGDVAAGRKAAPGCGERVERGSVVTVVGQCRRTGDAGR